MRRSTENPWLTRYAWFTAAATLVLICFGGLVTSKGAGLAVPDWPNSYGYGMFRFPASQWLFTWNGVFYEHSHRLVASGVGLLTVLLALWVWVVEARRWLRWLGLAAVFLVILQGVLGGLRVTLLSNELGWVHGALAQSFFAVVVAIALFSSRAWQRLPRLSAPLRGTRRWLTLATALIFLQLLLGAGMRHRHTGLAVPDFPLAYGGFWPSTSPESLARYNQLRMEGTAAGAIEAVDIHLHLAHRYLAVLLLVAVGTAATSARRRSPAGPLGVGSTFWVALVIGQAALGVWTVLSGKAADIATAHVAVGSLSLVTGVALVLIARRQSADLLPPAADARVSVTGESTVDVPTGG
ncbi:MAG: COX15/CtaA family protein [Verrucomicrobiae bacterium]|nr:COX15/CtaA family protein [Verrucomicrobiae bacterium]